MIIITDILKRPIDEGAKVTTENILKLIKKSSKTLIVAINSNSKFSYVDIYLRLNKLLFNFKFYNFIKKQNYYNMLYIPEASLTTFSFVRASLLHFFTGKTIYVFAMQPREYNIFSRLIIKFYPPQCIITQSKKPANYFKQQGIQSEVLPLGVDDSKYYEFDPIKKEKLRKKYKIGLDKTVLLHVGHIQKSRNLEWLIKVKKDVPDIEVIIVGSTYNKDDEGLYSKLINSGIRVFREYIPNMENIYNLADYYVFPVMQNDGAIETPLSVLEAMACNLPVITTRFGSLPETFESDEDFHFIETPSEIVDLVKQKKPTACKNREKIRPFTWPVIVQKLINIVGS